MGIRETVGALRDFGHKDVEIKEVIIRRYGISEGETEEYFT